MWSRQWSNDVVAGPGDHERDPVAPVLGRLPRMLPGRTDRRSVSLLVDDERALTNLVRMALAVRRLGDRRGAHDAGEAVEKYRANTPDILVLDIMLPDMDGLGVLQQIRDSDTYTPRCFSPHATRSIDRVTGLTAGGDDYMTKPFSLEELVARLRGLLRRSAYLTPADDETLIRRRPRARRREPRGHAAAASRSRSPPPSLSCCDFSCAIRGARSSRQEVLRRVWNYDFGGRSSIVDLYVSYLRKKVDAGREPMIHTVRGVGYMLRPAQ